MDHDLRPVPLGRAGRDEPADEIMMPLSLAVASRCDVVLRIGGSSMGADADVAYFQWRGLPVYHSLDKVPTMGRSARAGT